jgi:hypothetical protein
MRPFAPEPQPPRLSRRRSTKEDSLSKAKEVAKDWYLQLRGTLRSGEIKTDKTFREASGHYLREHNIITQGQRSKIYIKGQHWRSKRSTWSRSSAIWASRKLPLARFRTT